MANRKSFTVFLLERGERGVDVATQAEGDGCMRVGETEATAMVGGADVEDDATGDEDSVGSDEEICVADDDNGVGPDVGIGDDDRASPDSDGVVADGKA